MPIRFVKMHGTGNDFVVIDAMTDPRLEARFDLPTSGTLVRSMCDRNFGIGADGVILVCKVSRGSEADVRMRIFNSDGQEAQMCGNGLRCLAKFAHDRLGMRSDPLRVVTKRGTLGISCDVQDDRLVEASVDMGAPILAADAIPIDRRFVTSTSNPAIWDLAVGADRLRFACVSMGNPHAVHFVADVDSVDLAKLGPSVERHAAFPQGVNVHIAQPAGPVVEGGRHAEVRIRTWERGVGLTLACGTGACAVVVAGFLSGVLGRAALAFVPGGTLRVQWHHGTERVTLAGAAADVFEGEWLAPPDRPVAKADALAPETRA